MLGIDPWSSSHYNDLATLDQWWFEYILKYK